ncbi:MAG: TonB-dependent receptor plug domain-containing protein, partial [Bacteroidota bacterium]
MRLLTLFLFVVLALPALGQDTLFVVDETGGALPFASVRLVADGVWEGTTDAGGAIILPGGWPEATQVSVAYLSYATASLNLGRLRDQGLVLSLQPGSTLLAMPTVVGRRDEAADQLLYQVERISRQAIARTQSLTTADALADLSGVYVQKSQFGGGSPVIRGFEANRILLVVDGVRMNNAIFRNGHLQNAITVDPLALERMELIYGAGALAY